MNVMPAGMHDAGIFTAIGYIILLLYRQSIHIRAQSDDPAVGMLTLQQSYDARTRHDLERDTNARQLLLDEFRRLELLVRKLRMRMQMMPDAYRIRRVLFG